MQFKNFHWLSHHGIWAIIPNYSVGKYKDIRNTKQILYSLNEAYKSVKILQWKPTSLEGLTNYTINHITGRYCIIFSRNFPFKYISDWILLLSVVQLVAARPTLEPGPTRTTPVSTQPPWSISLALRAFELHCSCTLRITLSCRQ